MKKIELLPTEFYVFRKLALSMGIAFTCAMLHGYYVIEGNIDQLNKLGY
jgi:hypothetical protein